MNRYIRFYDFWLRHGYLNFSIAYTVVSATAIFNGGDCISTFFGMGLNYILINFSLQFFMELMKVPRVETKLRVFSFKIQFHSQVETFLFTSIFSRKIGFKLISNLTLLIFLIFYVGF